MRECTRAAHRSTKDWFYRNRSAYHLNPDRPFLPEKSHIRASGHKGDICKCPCKVDLNAHYFEPNDKRIKFRTKSLSIFDWFFQRKHQKTRNIRFGQKDCRWLAGIDSLLSGHANMTYLSLRTHYCIHPDEQRRLIRTFHRYAQYA